MRALPQQELRRALEVDNAVPQRESGGKGMTSASRCSSPLCPRCSANRRSMGCSVGLQRVSSHTLAISWLKKTFCCGWGGGTTRPDGGGNGGGVI